MIRPSVAQSSETAVEVGPEFSGDKGAKHAPLYFFISPYRIDFLDAPTARARQRRFRAAAVRGLDAVIGQPRGIGEIKQDDCAPNLRMTGT